MSLRTAELGGVFLTPQPHFNHYPYPKALGEGMNGYRPIVELMNTNFGIYGMAEVSRRPENQPLNGHCSRAWRGGTTGFAWARNQHLNGKDSRACPRPGPNL